MGSWPFFLIVTLCTPMSFPYIDPPLRNAFGVSSSCFWEAKPLGENSVSRVSTGAVPNLLRRGSGCASSIG